VSQAAAFSPDYIAARARFRSSSLALGARLESLPIGAIGPEGEELTIDIAVIGAAKPKRAVVVSSGLHGVEGYLGSAVQAALLEDVLGGWAPPADGALILLHALNPYGFAWTRRVNEDNVDLNRNFLLSDEDYSGSPEKYWKLDGLLNPPNAPRNFEFFRVRAVATIAQHGLPALKESVAGGQYDFPKGLFFGGGGPSQTQRLLTQKLPELLGAATDVLHIDFHTGLGKWGTYKLFVDQQTGSERATWLAKHFGQDPVEPWSKEGTSYAIRGGLGAWCQATFPNCNYDVLAAEFGTRQILTVIRALRTENQAHHYAEPGSVAYDAAKKQLKEVFSPSDTSWREGVVADGLGIVQTAIEAVLAEG